MIILGLDPDKGWAVVRNKKVIDAGTTKGMAELEKKIDLIARLCRDGRQELIVRIERPTNPKIFPRPGLSHGAMIKIARNVGQNYEKAESLQRFCKNLGLNVVFVSPARKKLNSKQVAALTGYKKRTSQHCRDSIMIAMR